MARLGIHFHLQPVLQQVKGKATKPTYTGQLTFDIVGSNGAKMASAVKPYASRRNAYLAMRALQEAFGVSLAGGKGVPDTGLLSRKDWMAKWVVDDTENIEGIK